MSDSSSATEKSGKSGKNKTVSFSQKGRKITYNLNESEKRGTERPKQTRRKFNREELEKILEDMMFGRYGKTPNINVLERIHAKYAKNYTEKHRKSTAQPYAAMNADIAHHFAKLIAFINENEIPINYDTLMEIFENIDKQFDNPDIQLRYKKKVLRHFLGKKSNASDTLLNAPLTSNMKEKLSTHIKVTETRKRRRNENNKTHIPSAKKPTL